MVEEYIKEAVQTVEVVLEAASNFGREKVIEVIQACLGT